MWKNEMNINFKTKPTNNVVNEDQKSPLAATGVNLLIAGAGFVYIHEYAKAVLSFIIVFISGMISALLGLSVLFGILALIFVMAWSYDETKKYNLNLDR
jgi:hypothetical protein